MALNPKIALIEGKNHRDFLRVAYQYAWTFSEDDVTKMGAIIVTPQLDEIITCAANHYPIGLNPTSEQKADRNYKYSYIIHAECAAINAAAKNGRSIKNHVMYMPWIPCVSCAKEIIDSGIKKMISHEEMIMNTPERWQEDTNRAVDLLQKCNVELFMYSGKIGTVKSLFNGSEWYP